MDTDKSQSLVVKHNHNTMIKKQHNHKTMIKKQSLAVEAALATAKWSLLGGVAGAFLGCLSKKFIHVAPFARSFFEVFPGGPFIEARILAVTMGVDHGLYCVMKRLRGQDDVESRMVAAFGSGTAWSLVRGMGYSFPVPGAVFAVANGCYFKLLEKPSKPPAAKDVLYSKTRGMLSSLGLHNYEENFRSGLLTDATLPLLSHRELCEVKIPPGPRLLILDHIQREAELNKGKGGRST